MTVNTPLSSLIIDLIANGYNIQFSPFVRIACVMKL